MKFPRQQVTWKPDLLFPVDDPKVWGGPLLFIRSITRPSGSLFAFTVKENDVRETEKDLKSLLAPIEEEDILVTSTIIEDKDFLHGAKLVIQTLKAGTFKPNILFLTVGSDSSKDHVIQELVSEASRHELGSMILRQHPRVAFGMQNSVNLWLRYRSPNWQLAMLIALQIQSNWEGTINLVTVTPDKADEWRMYEFLEHLSDEARLPSMTDFHVIVGSFEESLHAAPRADANIFGLSGHLDFDFMRRCTKLTESSCLFVKDSGRASALA